MKKLMKILLVLVIILSAGIYYFLSSLDMLIKKAIIAGGSKATQVEVSLGSVHFDIKGGSAALKNFVIGNPAGFKTDEAIALGGISAKVDLESIPKETVVINKIEIDDPVITYEISMEKGANINVLSNNINKFVDSVKPADKGEKKPADTKSASSEKKVIIKELIIRGGQINVSSDLLADKKISVSLPSIKLINLGKSENGITVAEAGAKMLQAIISEAMNSVANSNLIGIEGLKDQVKNMEDLDEKINNVQEKLNDAEKTMDKLLGK